MATMASRVVASHPCSSANLTTQAKAAEGRRSQRNGVQMSWKSRLGKGMMCAARKQSTVRSVARVSCSADESRLVKSLEEYYMDHPSFRSEQQWGPVAKQSAAGVWSISNVECPPSTLMSAGGSGGGIVAQQGQGPPPMLMERFQSVISQLFQNRIIRCGGAVEDDMANLIVAQLLYLDVNDPNKDIVMYVNSPGGSVTAGMAIFDTMRHIRPSVSTVCVGLAASMGAFLLSSGTKGKRFSLPNSRIMIHQPLGGAQGQQSDIEIQTNEILHHKANLNGYLAYQTGQPLEKIIQDTDRDFFMSAMEAKEYGLIDGVITNPLKALAKPVAA